MPPNPTVGSCRICLSTRKSYEKAMKTKKKQRENLAERSENRNFAAEFVISGRTCSLAILRLIC